MDSRIGLSGGDSESWISSEGGCSSSETTVVIAVAGGGRCTYTFSGSAAPGESETGWISCEGGTGCWSSETTVVVAVAGWGRYTSSGSTTPGVLTRIPQALQSMTRRSVGQVLHRGVWVASHSAHGLSLFFAVLFLVFLAGAGWRTGPNFKPHRWDGAARGT
jgi:hypothetical protein